MTKKQTKAVDDQISRIWTAECAGMTIDVMDIGKVFAAGRKAIERGEDLRDAILATVAQLRQN